TIMDSEKRGIAWLILIILSLVWGSSYILIKLSLFDLDGNERLKPNQLGAIRMSICALVLLPFFIKNFKKVKKTHVPFIFVAGLACNGIPAYLYSYAQTHLESTITGMLNSFVPVFAIALAALVFGFKIKWNHLCGIALGILGIYTIVYSKLKDVE